jgi:predicted nucleic acid-binding protein
MCLPKSCNSLSINLKRSKKHVIRITNPTLIDTRIVSTIRRKTLKEILKNWTLNSCFCKRVFMNVIRELELMMIIVGKVIWIWLKKLRRKLFSHLEDDLFYNKIIYYKITSFFG